MTRRDEVWEQKRQAAMARLNSSGASGAPGSGSRRPPPLGGAGGYGGQSQAAPAAPPSPLSQLVAKGYDPRDGGAGLPPRPNSRNNSRSQDGFSGNIQQQWKQDVQRDISAHQQAMDPTLGNLKRKPPGTRVLAPPGGGSSISLTWGGDAEPPRTGAQRAPSQEYGRQDRGGRAASPYHGGRAASPYHGGRAASPYRQPSGGFSQSTLDGYSSAPRANARPQSRERAPYANSPANYSTGPQAPYCAPTSGGAVYGRASGNGGHSSNAYACGANQNCGNFVTDRRTTRVAAPPGGRSQVCFG